MGAGVTASTYSDYTTMTTLKDKAEPILITIAGLGIIDMIVQFITDGELRLIRSLLSLIFGDR